MPSSPVLPRGVVPPLCTPLTASGEVDTRSLRALVERLLGAGVHGLFPLGTTGEAAHLTDAARRTVVETVADAAGGRVPVLAGVIDTGTGRVLEQARAAAEAGADALVATAPFFSPTHQAEIADHFRRVRAGTDLPLVAYDNPFTVHARLARDTVLALAADGTIAGLKDSSGDLGSLRRLLVALRERGPLRAAFRVFTGSELLVDGALLAGADGVVPGLGNVDPHGFVRLYEAAAQGRWEAAAHEQDRLAALFALTEAGDPAVMGAGSSAFGAFKAALRLLGFIEDAATAAPQVPLDEAAVGRVRAVLAGAGLL